MSTHSVSTPHDWATIAQAAERFGVSAKTIRRMISRGEARAERIGPRLVRVDLCSIRPVPLGPADDGTTATEYRPAVGGHTATGGDQ